MGGGGGGGGVVGGKYSSDVWGKYSGTFLVRKMGEGGTVERSKVPEETGRNIMVLLIRKVPLTAESALALTSRHQSHSAQNCFAIDSFRREVPIPGSLTELEEQERVFDEINHRYLKSIEMSGKLGHQQ